MPEKSTRRAEQPAASEITIIDLFYGTGAPGQIVELSTVPKQPLVVEVYDTVNKKWARIEEAGYVIVEGTRLLTLVALVAAAVAPARNKNISVRYAPASSGTGSPGALSPAAGLIELRDADPTDSTNIIFSPNTGKGYIERIIVFRTNQGGVPYTPNTKHFELFNARYDPGAPLTSDGLNTVYLNDSLEVVASGRLINIDSGTDNEFNKIIVINVAALFTGWVGVFMSAAGGAPGSEEDYSVVIEGSELI